MNTSTKTLPETYTQSGEIGLKNNKRLAITLNIVSFFVGVLSLFLLFILATWLRPSFMDASGAITPGGMVVLIGAGVILFPIHELIHGVFFWVFTRSRPFFAFRLFYACAGAPDWYIPTHQYMFVALGPLVIIDAVGVLFLELVPVSWVLSIAIILALNTGGAVGDLLVITRLFKLSPTSLTNDTGDVLTFYENQSANSHP